MIGKEVILVEGKTDVAKIKSIFSDIELDFLISNGLGFDEKFLRLCKKVNEERGIIIFTDPDGPGLKIRQKVSEYLNNNCLHAFVQKKNIVGSKKIGIAEASDKDVKIALEEVVTFNDRLSETITWHEYLQNEFNKKENRIKIANNFSWSENINAKTLFKWINYVGLNVNKIKEILEYDHAS